MSSTKVTVDEALAANPGLRAAVELYRRKRAAEELPFWCEHVSEEQPARFHRYMLSRLEAVERGECRRLMIFMPPGHAKALALDTPIPTPDGWKLMGRLVVGDRVFDETGAPCNVTWVSPVWRDRPVYRVITDCGDEIIADAQHEWAVCLDRKPRTPLKANGKGAPAKPDRDNIRSRVAIKETWELARKRSKRPMVFRAEPLRLPDASLPIDPYLLGVWLGDGTSSTAAITSSVEDQPWLRQELERLGYPTTDTSVSTLFRINGIRGELVKLGVLNDPDHKTYGRKHIPQIYMRASAEQRLSLLQGLVDTDGHVCPRTGVTTFCSTNLELATSAQELVRSLGAKASLWTGRAMLDGKDCGPAYRVGFYMEGSARMPRKAANARNGVRTPNTYLTAEPAGIADTVCIEVDSPSHLFLCGRSMTPTHNSTYASVRFPAWFMGRRKNTAVICASHTLGLAEKFSKRTRDIVGSQKFRGAFDFGLSSGSTGVGEWATEKGGEYFAVGVGGALPGRRGDLIIIDDPVSGPEAADSPNDRQKVFDWYLGSVRPRMKPGAAIVLIMQRWNEGDLAGEILPETWAGESGLVKSRTGETWEVISFPAAARADDVLGREPGEWLWPEYYPPDHYEMERSSQSPRNWSALYQQQPAPDTGDFFEREWLKFYPASQWRDWRTKRPDHLTIIGASDYAARETTGDYTVHGVFGLDPEGSIYVLDWWRKAAKPQEWSDAICDLVLKWKPRDWLEEKGPIAAANEAALRDRMRQRRAHTRIIGYASTKQKEVRAGAIRTLVQDGRVFIPNGAPWADDLIMEMMKFPASRNDDQVDVLSLIGRHIDRMPRKRVAPQLEAAKFGLNHVTLDRLWKQQKPSGASRLI